MKSNRLTKIVSLIVSMVMALGMMPSAAFAEAGETAGPMILTPGGG